MKGSCPNSVDVMKRTVSIPIYPALTDSEVEIIIREVNSINDG